MSSATTYLLEKKKKKKMKKKKKNKKKKKINKGRIVCSRGRNRGRKGGISPFLIRGHRGSAQRLRTMRPIGRDLEAKEP